MIVELTNSAMHLLLSIFHVLQLSAPAEEQVYKVQIGEPSHTATLENATLKQRSFIANQLSSPQISQKHQDGFIKPSNESGADVLSLQNSSSHPRTPESFGAAGDGKTDDTTAFQRLSTWMGETSGRGVVGRTGATYLVNNWIWPYQSGNSFICPSMCTVKAINSGDADYLVATSRYASNIGFLDYPVHTRNVVFDAAGVKTKAFAVQTYSSRFENTLANNATQDGWYLGALTRDGTAVRGTGIENKWMESGAYGNGRHGLYSPKYTDGQIIGGLWHGNGGPSGLAGYNIHLEQSSGWTLASVHTYNIVSLNKSQDLYLSGFGYGSTIANNYFEGIVTVASLENTARNASIGPGNTFMGGLNAVIANNGATTLTSFGNVFKSEFGQIHHQYFGADHVVRSVSDNFDTSVPFVWHNTASKGVIRAEGAYSKGLGGRLDGDFTGDSSVALNERRLRKTLSVDRYTIVKVSATIAKGEKITPFDVVLDVYGTEINDTTTELDAFSAQMLCVGSSSHNTVSAASNAVITHSNTTSSKIKFETSSSTSIESDDKTVYFFLKIFHPIPKSVSDSQIEIVARARGRSLKFLSVE